jgi:O-acetyl-ADP-ribose deacetylase (regulator of RNase III)
MIALQQGDITTAHVDAIINAANPTLLGGGGVDGAIHRAAGPGLLTECRAIPVTGDGVRCPIGDARITGAGALPCRYVIHTVGPRYDIDPDPPALLASAYRNSFALARQNGCSSVAAPAVSCGVYGYPWEEAATIALAVASEPENAELAITFWLFGDDMLGAWRNAYEALTAS